MTVQLVKKAGFVCAILCALLVTFGSCSVKDPEFSNLRDVKLIKMDGGRIDLQFTVDCDNPNGFGFKVKRSKLDVSVDGDALGVIALDEKIKIKRKSRNSYTVPVTVDLEDGALFRMVKYTTRKEVTVKVEGKVRGSVCGISKTMNVNEVRTVEGKMLRMKAGGD
jgi:LEA14-like dessication related protein